MTLTRIDWTLPASTRVAPKTIFLGDSITIGGQTLDGQNEWHARSIATQAVLRSGGRLVFERNAGVWGNTLAQMLARVATDVTAYLPDLVVLMGGTNDCTSGTVNMTTVGATYHSLVQAIVGCGARPLLCTLAPREDSQQARRNNETFNRWLWAYATQYGYDLIDCTAPVVDAADGGYLAGTNADQLHPNTHGGALIGQAIADYVAGLVAARPLPFAYHTDENQNMLGGDGAFALDTNADGVANGWTWTRGSATATTSLVSEAGVVGNWQQMAVTANAASTPQFSRTLNSGWSVGNRLRFTGRVKLSGFAGSLGAYCLLDFGGGNRLSPLFDMEEDGTYSFSLARTVPTGTTSITAKAYFGVGGTGTLSIAQWSVVNETTASVTPLGST